MNVSSIEICLRMKNTTIILVQLKDDYPFTIEEIKVECGATLNDVTPKLLLIKFMFRGQFRETTRSVLSHFKNGTFNSAIFRVHF